MSICFSNGVILQKLKAAVYIPAACGLVLKRNV
jgi:hypothetical protein